MTKYEQERQQEKQKRVDLVQSVLSHLPGWTMDIQDHDGYGSVQATKGQARLIFIVEEYRSPDKMKISGHFPTYADRTVFYFRQDEINESGYVLSIGVSTKKDPSKIARDITNRLLPSYEKALAHAVQSIADRDAYQARELSLKTAVADFFGSPLKYDNGHVPSSFGSRYSQGIEVQPTSATSLEVTIRLEGKTVPEIMEQLKAVREHVKPLDKSSL